MSFKLIFRPQHFPWHLVRACACVAMLLLAACSDDDAVYTERPVEELYNTAMDNLLDKSIPRQARALTR